MTIVAILTDGKVIHNLIASSECNEENSAVVKSLIKIA